MLKIKRLLIDYLVHPVGVDGVPQFSWEMESSRRNVVQEAYRLQISEDSAFSHLLYDSGKMYSSQSAHVVPENVELSSASVYYARVKGWDGVDESIFCEPVSFVTGLLNGEQFQAAFVSGELRNFDTETSKGTYVRGSFTLKGKVKEAYAFTTALGLYNFYLNGKKVGFDEMAPGWTSYRKHLTYQTYDVTSYLKEGENGAGAMIGAGWYKGVMGLTKARNNYGDQTAFAMELHVTYEDGEKELFCTDESWMGTDSPVVFAEIYDGEIYDASLEIQGWSEACIPEGNWHPVEMVTVDPSILRSQYGSRVSVIDRIPAKRVFVTPKGETVVDFGQNMAGRISVTAKGKKGDVIELYCFEVLDKDGNVYPDNMREAKSTMKYIFGRDGEATYHPHFTYMGFQYALIRSCPGKVKAENFVAEVLHSQMEPTGNITCSNPLLNQLHHNYLWGLKGNFLDVPTDCPQRDERLGWTGDAQIFCRTACYLMNTYHFYRKWLVDVEADQTPEGGVPHVVPNIEEGKTDGNWLLSQGPHSAAAWADAAVINPWTMYLMYGDVEILRRQYKSMKNWITFMRCHSEDYIWNYKLQFGDWVALDAEEGSYFGATPNELTCTAYYAYSTGIFAKIARILGNKEDAEEYQKLYEHIVDKFQRTFFDKNGKLTAQTQTAHIVALYFGLTPKEYVPVTVSGLKQLLDKENGHLVTGFVGTPYFCHALSENGCVKEAYDLLLKEDFPSWLYQVKMGATTIWEHWDGIKPDGSMWSADMNSFNHYAYGAIGEWMYRVMAGLEVDEKNPGFLHSIIYPRIVGDLSFVEGSFHSVYGEHKVRWERNGDCVTLKVTIPVNTTASIRLDEGKEVVDGDGLTFTQEENYLSAQAGSGMYTITFKR